MQFPVNNHHASHTLLNNILKMITAEYNRFVMNQPVLN